MKKIFFIIAFLISAHLGMALSDSTATKPIFKTLVFAKDTTSDGWNDNSWSPEPLLNTSTVLTKKELRKAKKAKNKAQKITNDEYDELSNQGFPKGVGWASVALALIGLVKIFVQNCK